MAIVNNVTRLLEARKINHAAYELPPEKLGALEKRAVKRLVIILGGAYGLDETTRRRGELLALSALTFSHELCRLVLLEQLYRARTIQRGEPYHHG